MIAGWRSIISARVESVLIVVGYLLIAFGVAVGLVLREELDWFFAVAGPGLLCSTVGFAVFGVGIWRRGTMPRWAALLAGVGGVLAILLSEFGTSVLIGAFWISVAVESHASLGRRAS